jgi:F-type H+-transporting ATPase subunit b
VLIDWFTVIAQIVNFLVLVALLKHFLYDRIIGAMNEREERIRGQLEDAENKKEEAQKEADEYRQKKQELEKRRQDELSRIKEETGKKRTELLQQARDEAENKRKQWQQSIQQEKESFVRELRQMAVKQVYVVARRVLQDLADVKLQEKVVEVFLQKIEEMEEGKQQELAEAIKNANDGMFIASSFDIPSKTRRKITRSLHESVADDIDIRYETKPDIILGMELKVSGKKIAWNLEDYVGSLEQEAREALQEEAREV